MTRSYTAKVTKALREGGLTVSTNFPPPSVPAEKEPDVIILGGWCVNIQIFNKLGYGQINNPLYEPTMNEMVDKVTKILNDANIPFIHNLRDQLFLTEVCPADRL